MTDRKSVIIEAITLDYRIRLEGMLAENADRQTHDYSMAYTADDFDKLADKFKAEVKVVMEA